MTKLPKRGTYASASMRQSAASLTLHTFPNAATTTNPTNRIGAAISEGLSKQ